MSPIRKIVFAVAPVVALVAVTHAQAAPLSAVGAGENHLSAPTAFDGGPPGSTQNWVVAAFLLGALAVEAAHHHKPETQGARTPAAGALANASELAFDR